MVEPRMANSLATFRSTPIGGVWLLQRPCTFVVARDGKGFASGDDGSAAGR
jgi:hypothetical protein